MKRALLFSLMLSFSAFAQPFLAPSSAVRQDGEDYTVAMERNTVGVHKTSIVLNPDAVKYSVKKYAEYEFPEMEEWDSYSKVKEAHRYVRDLRFVPWEYEEEDFPRRSSWLYPDDGCFIRAELMVENLLDFGQPLPKKIFVIGNLKVKTKNSVNGKVSWWYHVAPIVKAGKDHYILDPALKTKKPLKLESWLKLMNEDIDNLRIAICESRTMTPADSCGTPYQYDLEQVMEYQYFYLNSEWNRVLQLGKDPVKLLGDNPPWKLMLFGFIPIEI